MKCKKLVRAIIAFAVAGSMSMTVNATSISDLKDQKDQKESKKEGQIDRSIRGCQEGIGLY